MIQCPKCKNQRSFTCHVDQAVSLRERIINGRDVADYDVLDWGETLSPARLTCTECNYSWEDPSPGERAFVITETVKCEVLASDEADALARYLALGRTICTNVQVVNRTVFPTN